MKVRRVIPLVLLAAGLSACGPSLGSYDVVDLAVVDDLPESYVRSRPPQQYLRIELASEFDLVADGNGNIYAYKTECKRFADELGIVFGPLAAGDPPIDLYDARPAVRREPSGAARYLLFVPVSAPARRTYSNAEGINPAYDLRKDDGDLCLKISQAGYFITESRSDTIRIPASELFATLD